ncbi:putative nucleic acid-binding protein [Mucilaginibacter sp. UYP25]|uniref:type II toxin-antitoxin system VapC family toxin n=1 Tax=unclassified Mucilaginibacter TaxID=2617802 RepID=UPI0033939FF7
MIFDTNILIYISKNVLKITDLIPPNSSAQISVISYVEAMGFSFETEIAERYMQEICSSCQIIPLSESVIQETITIRKQYRIKLPDAIIYATALVQKLPLLTNNIADFKSLGNKVELIDPFKL